MSSSKGVAVVDIQSGAIVKRYATLKDAAARNLYGQDTVRNYCNHQLDESGMYRRSAGRRKQTGGKE